MNDTQMRHMIGWFIIGILGMSAMLAAGYWGSYQSCKAGEGKLVGGPIAYACVGYSICDPYTQYQYPMTTRDDNLSIPELRVE